jgi:homoserine kinase
MATNFARKGRKTPKLNDHRSILAADAHDQKMRVRSCFEHLRDLANERSLQTVRRGFENLEIEHEATALRFTAPSPFSLIGSSAATLVGC